MVLPSRMPAFANVAVLQELSQAGLQECLPGLQGSGQCTLSVLWLSGSAACSYLTVSAACSVAVRF